MKNISGKVFFILSSIWYSVVSLVSPYWLLLTFAFFADVHSDEYDVCLLLGSILLIVWVLFFVPCFTYLTTRLKERKKSYVFIPPAVFIILSAMGGVVVFLMEKF